MVPLVSVEVAARSPYVDDFSHPSPISVLFPIQYAHAFPVNLMMFFGGMFSDRGSWSFIFAEASSKSPHSLPDIRGGKIQTAKTINGLCFIFSLSILS